MPLITNYSQVI